LASLHTDCIHHAKASVRQRQNHFPGRCPNDCTNLKVQTKQPGNKNAILNSMGLRMEYIYQLISLSMKWQQWVFQWFSGILVGDVSLEICCSKLLELELRQILFIIRKCLHGTDNFLLVRFWCRQIL